VLGTPICDFYPPENRDLQKKIADEHLVISQVPIVRYSQQHYRVPRPVIVILDDMLNSGKHFKVAQKRIRERWPDVDIRGLFLARCIRD
jgi:hypothetical protein